jgi:hypothetical protein
MEDINGTFRRGRIPEHTATPRLEGANGATPSVFNGFPAPLFVNTAMPEAGKAKQ